MPGDTATFASASIFLANSIDPCAAYASGIFAQMYIDAFGTSTIQPASCRPFAITSRRRW